jgi:gas vesicle protein
MKFLLGLIAGAAVVHFLSTDQGKEFVEKMKKEADHFGENIGSLADDLLKKGKSFVGGTTEQAAGPNS